MNNPKGSFTFITLTYNHSKYIIEHLDSILNIVKDYGHSRIIDLIITDDCSDDNTTEIINEWLIQNKSSFRNVLCLYSNVNHGVIWNLRKAIENVTTENYKFLAGDDKYYYANIFELVESIDDNSLLITPVIPFGRSDNVRELVRRQRTLVYSISVGRLHQLLKYENYIQAPGVFYAGNVFRDETLWECLKTYRNIEDYPMWLHLVIQRGTLVKVRQNPFVCYRMGSGITSKKKHTKRGVFECELERIRKDFKIRRYRFPKFINVYRYLSKINRGIIYIRKKHIDNMMGNDPVLQMYIEL